MIHLQPLLLLPMTSRKMSPYCGGGIWKSCTFRGNTRESTAVCGCARCSIEGAAGATELGRRGPNRGMQGMLAWHGASRLLWDSGFRWLPCSVVRRAQIDPARYLHERCVVMAEPHRGDIWPFSIPIGAQAALMGAAELKTSRVAALESRTRSCRSPNLHGFLAPPCNALLRYRQLRQKARYPQLDAHWSSTSQRGWRLPAARRTHAAMDTYCNTRELVDKVLELVGG